MEIVILTEICKKCAECCKNYPFIDLSNNDISIIEKATGLLHDVFTNKKGNEPEEYFLQFKENGYCLFLAENNGSFSCSVYEARPAICQSYPSKLSQKELCDANMAKFLDKNLS
jgi:Fe-S-cluster containining protein